MTLAELISKQMEYDDEWNDFNYKYKIVYANDTNVKYMIIKTDRYKYSITALYNADGSLQVYEE